MRPWQTLRSSKSLFVRVFYGEKVEKEGRRELSIRDETSGNKLLKTLNKKKVVQTGIRMKDSALRANSCNESYNETYVSEKRGKLQAMFTKTEKCHNSYSGAGRSRSSLLGSLLSNNPLIMYWFEPVSVSDYHTSNP